MDVEEALKFTDHLALTTTGKHLDSLQKAILRGAWDNQKYKEIAQHHNRSEKYVKEVGFKLWKLMSVALGEEQVCKANFRAKLENLQASNIVSLVGNGCIHIGNISAESLHSPEASQSEPQDKDKFNEKISNSEPKIHLDLGDAPEPNLFYNRTSELTTLENWISSRTRLITILGLSGIGKTALTLQLIPQIQHEFDCIIWRSLHNAPPLQTLQTELIQFCRGGAPVPEERATTGGLPLLEYLRSYRCLLILDDIQTIFSSQQLAGNYQPGYENYGTFFKQIAESSHNSCLILLSWEKPREIAALEGENRPCKSLQLNGLGPEAQEIFREKGLAEPEKWSELIDLYRGNPLWLNIIATLIQDLFGGSVSEFLSYDTLFLGDLESLLEQQCDRLTEPEKQVISSLASEAAPVEISKISAHLELSPSALLQAVQSLGRRLLIEKVKQGQKTLFTLQPVLIEYLKNQH
ncbi:MAG: ATPase [Microcoleus sp. PH2017_40_RAT_O_B]|uniref:NB-ARC domain-containing protein n=1 Tax=unclassified Microcoleus TaxID=2642155 RepID=UPI001D7FFF9C|nr:MULTISPECIES: NB-ARC domain-containing protein [unclassified Microcoleus]MCC3575469.1 ATPase [Microcoleus sp. PH2017_34_RAT_O_A]MCC3613157.1 ATPase [Microcoleus sp. PH2017_40_RAT_O_B]